MKDKKITKLEKKIDQFQKKNPEIIEAMKIFEITMSHYEQTLRSIEPTRTSTSSSTKVLK